MASTESSSECQRLRPRAHRNSLSSSSSPSSPETTRCKSSISSLIFSTFNSTTTTTTTSSSSSSSAKKKSFGSSTFRGLSCASPQDVSAPAPAPTAGVPPAADWQPNRVRRKKQRKRKPAAGPAVVVPDVWCSPGIVFAADAAASVDCVVSRRPAPRPRADGDRNQGERSLIGRRVNILDRISSIDSPYALESPHFDLDHLPFGHHRHSRGIHRSPGGVAEIMILQNGYLLGGSNAYDRYGDWRLDVDNMSYEELLELGDKIGYVNTGLTEEEIVGCLRKMEHSILDALPLNLHIGPDQKCSICQEDFEHEDEVGKLECGHSYHMYCIKQWLLQKNVCPVCKVAAA